MSRLFPNTLKGRARDHEGVVHAFDTWTNDGVVFDQVTGCDVYLLSSLEWTRTREDAVVTCVRCYGGRGT